MMAWQGAGTWTAFSRADTAKRDDAQFSAGLLFHFAPLRYLKAIFSYLPRIYCKFADYYATPNIKDPAKGSFIFGAGNRTWTCMKLLSHGPEPCASANSAIPAYYIAASLRLWYCITKKPFCQWQKCKNPWLSFLIPPRRLIRASGRNMVCLYTIYIVKGIGGS